MTRVRVVDASALAAVLFGEPDAERVIEEIGDHRLAAPALLPFEMASVCLKKIRRHPEQRAALVGALGRLPDLGVTEAPVDASQVVRLAERTKLSAYDAAYLWLMVELDTDLVTLDRRLATAAAKV